MLEAYLVSAATVFLAEFADKSQLLAMVLAARFQRPAAVIAGMGVGLLANHLLAAVVGAFLARLVPPDVLRWIIAGGFFAAAIWAVLPHRPVPAAAAAPRNHWGPFLATALTFFLVEMGDKTQLMTMALVARFDQPLAVVAGTLTGIMAALVPAVIFADRLLARLPVRLLRFASALVFVAVSLATLLA